MKRILFAALSGMLLFSCGRVSDNGLDSLRSEIAAVAADAPAQVGVAVIFDGGDTLTVNNSADYPLMSMFKLHQAVAVCRKATEGAWALDSTIIIDRRNLDANTWSPMLKTFGADTMSVPLSTLIDYILIDSDNNASNLLFDEFVSVALTDSIVRSLVPDGSFVLRHREADMVRDHNLAYENVSSPMAYAVLVDSLFSSERLLDEPLRDYVLSDMKRCVTGMNRIAAGLPAGAVLGHRTGSGYINEDGKLVAQNDGGRVELPGGASYTIAVFVKDYAGPAEDAEAVIARISAVVAEYAAAKGVIEGRK